MMKTLIVLLGPTGVGKTELSLLLAQKYNTSIVSADSRQLYKGMRIGTAAPTVSQLQQAKHYLVDCLEIASYYSASNFEADAVALISQQLQSHDVALAVGGSMLYIDALCNGIDDMPTIDDQLRQRVWSEYEQNGLEFMQAQLKLLDPVFYDQVDLKNHKRVIHAVEVCLMTGQPYSQLRTKPKKQRPFRIVKIGLMRDRPDLYDRINKRVDQMMHQGLLDEVKALYPMRHLNALNTVGYKELFNYLDGTWTLDFAVEKIKQNSRIYSRKQMTWFKKDAEINWINLSQIEDVTTIVDSVERFIS